MVPVEAVLSQHLGDYATSKSAMSVELGRVAGGTLGTAKQIWPSMPEHRDCAWEFAPAG